MSTTNNSFESFDADDMDWDGDTIPSEEEIGFDVAETALRVAVEQHIEVFGWTYVKPSALRESAKKLFKVKQVITDPAHREWFQVTWPEYLFVWDEATQHNDHPLSHLATELNELEAMYRDVADGTPFIDLFGNVGRDAKYKRKCLTLYNRMDARDYLRYQHAGKFPNARQLDWKKLIEGRYQLDGKRIHHVYITHALYYLHLDEIAEYCNAHPLNRVVALIHRHPDSAGTLNAGEQQYTVSEDGIVTQWNTLTGEKYSHPSMEALFHQFNCKTNNGGLAWTTRKLGGDTFQIDFVGCPADVCGKFVPFKYLKPTTRTEETYSSLVVRRFLHFTWTWTVMKGRRVLLEDGDLLMKLRRYIAGKIRMPRQKTELMNYARRLTNKDDIIAIHGGGAHEIDMAMLVDYVEAAFYMDIEKELTVALEHHKANASMLKALNNYIEKGEMPRDLTIPRAVVEIGSSIILAELRKPHDAIGVVMDSLLEYTQGKPNSYLARAFPKGPDIDYTKW